MQQSVLDAPQVFSVLGVPVHLAQDYLTFLLSCLRDQQGCHIVTLNAEMTMQTERTPALAEVIRDADLIIPDGAGVVLYLQLFGKRVPRCPGIELAESLLRELARVPALGSAFFFGGKPGVPEQAAIQMQQRFPGLAIAGTQHGYLPPEAEAEFLEQLRASRPRIILVGLGVPRQEFWIAQHRHVCPDAIWIGVGGSFDVWAGVKDRAPTWLRNNHLEWLYRLYKEPWRWRRMLDLPRFAWRSLVYRVTRRGAVRAS